MTEQPESEGPFSLKDHTFFKKIGNYGQVVIPDKMRVRLGIKGEEVYSMIILIPLISKEASMSEDEAYEYLEYLISQSERTPE